jgi:hypothetical protein
MAATMRTTLSFAWHVISNVLQILIVLYVFSRLQVRFEVIVVAILGLIYVTIQGIGFGIRLMMGMLTINVQKDLIFIRKKMGDNVSAREKEASATESKMTSMPFTLLIDGVGFSLIFLICLYQLFNAL